MDYTLITKTGQIMRFYLLETALCYQSLLGGVVVVPQILEQESLDTMTV